MSQILRPGVLGTTDWLAYFECKKKRMIGVPILTHTKIHFKPLCFLTRAKGLWPIPAHTQTSYSNKHHVSRKRGLSPVDLSKSQQHSHAWKPKKHDLVLADLALVNLLVNGASGKEPGHINPCWLIFAYLHTHVHVNQIQFGKTNLFYQQPWAVSHVQLELSVQLLFHVLPFFTRPCRTCRCSRASFVRHATPGPSPASPWIPRKNASPEVVKGFRCESVNIIPSQHYWKYLPVKSSKHSYQLQYDPTCPIICSKV